MVVVDTMTEWGRKLPSTPVEDLKVALSRTEDPKGVKRAVAALAYKHGWSPATIEAVFGFSQPTVYRWLDRLENQGIEAGLTDDPRPGRPSKLEAKQHEQLSSVLAEAPESAGYEAADWTPELLQQWLKREFEVTYSRRHARRLLKSYRAAENG